MDHRVPYLIAQYRKGKITAGEQAELDLWISQIADNRRIFEHVAGVSAVEKYKDYSSIDREKAWHEVRRRVAPPKRTRVWWVAAAAVVVLATFFVGLGDRFFNPSAQLVLADVAPGSSKAVLTLDDGTEIALEDMEQEVVHGGSHITIAGGEVSYSHAAPTTRQTYNSVTVPRGGEYKITLSDGTKVWLNADSKLRYPLAFAAGERRVQLHGEAYFDVVPNAESPFVVQTDGQNLTVLGTQFNVAAYGNDAFVATTLVSGSVRVVGKSSGAEITLTPGQQARLDNRTGMLAVDMVNVDDYVSWRTGFINIDGNTLGQVLDKLSRWYDVDFAIADDRARGIVFEGDIPKNSGLASVIKTLERAGNIKFAVRGDKIEATSN